MTKVLGIFGFLQFGWADILDIGMVALLIYFLLRSIRGDSTVLNIVLVLSLLLVGQAIASALNMRMMTVLLNALLDVGVLAIIIIFQPEIRHLLNRVAMQTGISRRTGDLFNRLLGIKEERLGSRSVEELVEAVRAMSAEKTGALIVIQHKSSMDEFMDTGDRFDAEINRRLIHPDTACNIDIGVTVPQTKPAASLKNRHQKVHTVIVGPCRGAPWQSEICPADKSLYLNEKRPRALEGARDNRAGRSLRLSAQHIFGRIRNLGKPGVPHFKYADLIG